MKHFAQIFACAALSVLSSSTIAQECPQSTFHGFTDFNSAPVTFVSDPVIGTNENSHLEVFAVGTDGALWHSWQMPPDFKKWSPWASFGSPPGIKFPAPTEQPWQENTANLPQLAVVQDYLGRLQVFVAAGNAVWQIGQVAKNVNWNTWKVAVPAARGFGPTGVWAIANLDKHLELFVYNGSNSSLQHTWQFVNNPTWFPLADFGSPTGAPPQPTNIALGMDSAKRIVVAMVADGSVYVRHQDSANDGWKAWEPAGQPDGVTLQTGTALLASNADGHLELMAKDAASQDYWHAWQSSPDTWSYGWANFGSASGQPQKKSFDSALAQGPGNCLSGLAIVIADPNENTSDRLVPVTQKHPSADWKGW